MAGFELPERFWAKVKKGGPDECWEWTSTKSQRGYARFSYEGRKVWAARLVLMSLGFDMTGLLTRHKCDNPPCVNPNHLEPGTHADNFNDSIIHGRRMGRKFAVVPKLSEQDVIEIRRAHEALRKTACGRVCRGGATGIARRFRINRASVTRIISRRAWAHI